MENETKQCKYCLTEIPKKAKICPNCKKKQGMGCLPKIGIVLAVLIVLGLFGGGNDEIDEETIKNLTYVSSDQIDMVYSDTEKYDGKGIVIGGQVFGEPDVETGEITFQLYVDPINYEKNTIIVYKTNDSISLKDGDYVIIDGVISGVTTYTNIIGGTMQAPTIQAINVKKTDYIEAVSKTEKTIEVNHTQEQYGYSVTVDKVEFSPIETRVYLTVVNNGSANLSIYDFDIKIVQNGTQYTSEYNYQAGYDVLESEIISGVTDNSIVTFPVLDKNLNFQIYIDGYSHNWDEEIETYIYDISIE